MISGTALFAVGLPCDLQSLIKRAVLVLLRTISCSTHQEVFFSEPSQFKYITPIPLNSAQTKPRLCLLAILMVEITGKTLRQQ
jgi:hypothetical protein